MSHTATEQWQSFEMRMRHRRAERCRLRAEVAAQQGCYDEAAAALAEASRLEPDAPENALVERMIAAPSADAEDAPQPRRRAWKWIAATAMLVLGAAAGSGLMFTHPATGLPSSGGADTALSGSPTSGATGAREVRPVSTLTVARTPGDQNTTPAGDIAAPRSDQAQALSGGEPSGTAGSVVLPQAEAAPASAPPPAEPVGASSPEAAGNVVPPPSPPPAVAAAALSDPPARIPGEVVAMATPLVSDEASRIRSVLARYEAAYSSLDAGAAGEVWPGVDQRALARAFESLESQRVFLGDCNVTISASTAHAECSGSTNWTPKVGGGRRTQPHSWSFDLAKQSDAWVIHSANIK